MDITKKLPTVIAFCAGYCGIERGLDLAGVKHRVLAYVEIEAFAIANLVSKMESGELVPAPIFTDLKTFPAHLFRDCVDIITGGYPCQPFSAAGKRLGTEDPRHLWPFIRRHIESIRPVRCFFENVEGHISLGLREVIGDLEGAGYQATWGIFSAAEVGAPHQRKRVYIMANSISAGVWDNDRPPANEGRSAAQFGRADVRQGDREERSVRPESAGSSSAAVLGSEVLADTISEGLQRHARDGNDIEESGRYRAQATRSTSASSVSSGELNKWPPEPRLGRVVDGCPDRVDRIRLLGNGVVPQTAAKAWITLNERIKNEH